jgi:hypothetical protein
MLHCVLLFSLPSSHIGAQLSHSASPGSGTEVGVPVVHVKYTELVERVEASRECRRRFVGGVMPDVVVRHWKQLGYSVRSGAQVRGGRVHLMRGVAHSMLYTPMHGLLCGKLPWERSSRAAP